MPRKHHTSEEIVAKLRQVDVLIAQGRSTADTWRATSTMAHSSSKR